MRRMSLGSLTPVLTAALLLFTAAVMSLLCAGAVQTQRSASMLSQATEAAGSAAELYYACDGAEELALYLSGESRGDSVTAELPGDMRLEIVLSHEDGLGRADISVLSDGREIFSMSCLKAERRGGR